MPEPRFTMETIYRIYDDKVNDEYLEIGMDADVGTLIEIRSCRFNELTRHYDIVQRITIEPDSVDLVIQALERFKKV